MTDRFTAPDFGSRHFACPHCHEVSEQSWLNAYVSPISNPGGVPLRIQGEDLERLARNPQFPDDVRKEKVAYWQRVNNGDVFIDRWAPVQSDLLVAGLEISVCHRCMASAIWLGGRLTWPAPDKG